MPTVLRPVLALYTAPLTAVKVKDRSTPPFTAAKEHDMTGSHSADALEVEFARRAASYLREQGLTEEAVQEALVEELGLREPEAEELIAQAEAA